jgi:hypothetical protein
MEIEGLEASKGMNHFLGIAIWIRKSAPIVLGDQVPFLIGEHFSNLDITRSRMRQTRKLQISNATYLNIDRWYRRMLDDVGYMILAKGKGYDAKIQSYKESFANLLKTIELVRKDSKGHDRIRDLTVLHKKATYVYEFVKTHL